MSGPRAVDIASACVRSARALSAAPGHSLTHGYATTETGEVIDEVVVGLFHRPHSYTGEDVVEISCHGNPVVTRAILDRLIALGARLAGPGEFTRRAFLNGKLDLAQAEAVCRLIEARGLAAARGAARQLAGGLSSGVKDVRARIVALLGELEVHVDFPDEDLDEVDAGALLDRLREAEKDTSRLVVACDRRRELESVPHVAIVGAPNAGKSSLFNAIAGRERAIVHEAPGTTRDVVDTEVALGDLVMRLTDTAGLRAPSPHSAAVALGAVEAEGVRRSREVSRVADRLIVVLDGSRGELTVEEQELITTSERGRAVMVVNKSDLPRRLPARALDDWEPACVSAVTGEGLDALLRLVAASIEGGGAGAEVERASGALTRGDGASAAASGGGVRIERALHDAAAGMRAAVEAFEGTGALELCAEELRRAADALGLVTGERTGPELLDMVFSRFCIGK